MRTSILTKDHIDYIVEYTNDEPTRKWVKSQVGVVCKYYGEIKILTLHERNIHPYDPYYCFKLIKLIRPTEL